MRNTELIAEIYKMASSKYSEGLRGAKIAELIEMERPEIARNNLWKNKDNFWKGGHLKTDEEWLEEMRKYPHRDNHMD